ncbi:hypothetical protein [Streptomyces sp. NPDC052701]|uniref:hypothetical protein n=1 Tax=Streptomyces sp. NPDC052701 TaxID=3155533 RepID=UPI00344AD926
MTRSTYDGAVHDGRHRVGEPFGQAAEQPSGPGRQEVALAPAGTAVVTGRSRPRRTSLARAGRRGIEADVEEIREGTHR